MNVLPLEKKIINQEIDSQTYQLSANSFDNISSIYPSSEYSTVNYYNSQFPLLPNSQLQSHIASHFHQNQVYSQSSLPNPSTYSNNNSSIVYHQQFLPSYYSNNYFPSTSSNNFPLSSNISATVSSSVTLKRSYEKLDLDLINPNIFDDSELNQDIKKNNSLDETKEESSIIIKLKDNKIRPRMKNHIKIQNNTNKDNNDNKIKKKKSSYIRVSPFDRIVKRDIRRQIPVYLERILNSNDEDLVKLFVSNFFTQDFKSFQYIPKLLARDRFPLVINDFYDFINSYVRLFHSTPDSCFRILDTKIKRNLYEKGCVIDLRVNFKGTRIYVFPEVFINTTEIDKINLVKDDQEMKNETIVKKMVNFFQSINSKFITTSNVDSNHINTPSTISDFKDFDKILESIESYNLFNDNSLVLNNIDKEKLIQIYKQYISNSLPYIKKKHLTKIDHNDIITFDISGSFKLYLDENNMIYKIESIVV